MMKGDGAMSLDAEGEGERRGYNLSREALERLIEAARRSAPYPDLENTKSLSRSRVSPRTGLLRVYCEVIKSFYRLACFFRLTRLDSTRLTHSRTAHQQPIAKSRLTVFFPFLFFFFLEMRTSIDLV